MLNQKLEVMKPLKKSKLFISFMLMLFTSSIIGFWSCEDDSIFENQYPEFLKLDSYNLSEISKKDMSILNGALGRLDVYKKNGFYHVKQTSGAQVNISEDLFNFIKSLYDNTNDIKSQSCKLSYSVPRLKSEDPEGTDSSSSDCMARAISYAGGGTYGSVGSYLISQYGSGVPLSDFNEVCHHFFPSGETVSISDIPDGGMNDEIIIFMTGDSTAHAVNGIWYSEGSGTIIFHDEQSGQDGSLDVNDVVSIYRP